MHVAHRVEQRAHLALAGADDTGIRMPGRGDPERGGEVEILASLGIPDVVAPRLGPDDGPGAVRIEERDVPRFVAAQQVERAAGGHRRRLHTPRSSGGQTNLCIWSWKRTGRWSATMASTSSLRVIAVWPGGTGLSDFSC